MKGYWHTYKPVAADRQIVRDYLDGVTDTIDMKYDIDGDGSVTEHDYWIIAAYTL